MSRIARFPVAQGPHPFARTVAFFSCGFAVSLAGLACFNLRASHGGGQTRLRDAVPSADRPARPRNASDVALPDGYAIEIVARGLVFPTGVTFDDEGGVYVVESGHSTAKVKTTPRLLRIDGGSATEIAHGTEGPWNGVFYKDGTFYVADGRRNGGGRVLAIAADGTQRDVVTSLPTEGDHATNGPLIGPDGSLYFSIGTATNSSVVGEDNLDMGWLRDHRLGHDVPCEDVELTGVNFRSRDVFAESGGADRQVLTGPFKPFGIASEPGEVVRGEVPCSGGIFRVTPTTDTVELVAWGFRNPFGMAFGPGGQLYVIDNSYDDRGSRPVFGTGDVLWAVEPGAWYGWPDFHQGHSLANADHYRAPGKREPQSVLARMPGVQPPPPVVEFGVHSSSDGFDFSFNPAFGHVGDAFVAQFGDEAPAVGKVVVPVGFKVVRVDMERRVVHDFAVNRGDVNGPASKLGRGGLERPVAARFDPTGTALYVVDFGVVLHDPEAKPQPGTGTLWRIRRTDDASLAAGGAR